MWPMHWTVVVTRAEQKGKAIDLPVRLLFDHQLWSRGLSIFGVIIQLTKTDQCQEITSM